MTGVQTCALPISILESVGAYFTDEGAPAGVVIVFRDQTAQRERQKQIEENEQKYRALFDATTDAIVLMEDRRRSVAEKGESAEDRGRALEVRDLIVRDVNDMFLSLFGSQEQDLFARLAVSSDGQSLLDLCRLVHADASARGGEFMDVEAEKYFLATVYSPGEGLIAVLLHDFTERRKGEAALIENMKDLQRFNNLTIDRELRMIELKREVDALLVELGRAARYGRTE